MTKSGKYCGKKEKLLVLNNFFFCHYVFKEPSAAEVSESVYMRFCIFMSSKGKKVSKTRDVDKRDK